MRQNVAPDQTLDDSWGADPRAILTALSSVVYQWDIANDRIEWGANAAEVLGVDTMERLRSGQAWRKLLSSRSPVGRDEAILASNLPDEGAGAPFHVRYEIVLPNGPAAVEDQGRWFAGIDGAPTMARGIIKLSGRAEQGARAKPQDLAEGARADLLRRIALAMEASRAHGRPFALLTGCVRDYRIVDTRYGSEDADAVVGVVLERLAAGMRQSDLILRYGSNRFAVVLGHCPRDDLEGAATRLSTGACSESVPVAAGSFTVGISWGGLSDLEGAREARTVLRHCEEAMQQARARGVNFVHYAPDRKRESRRLSEQAIVEDALRALNDRRILIARQPIVDARSRAVRFEEALVRMRREDGEIVAAGSIVPVFEKLGRIELIDHRVLELAIATLIHEPDSILSVNVSTRTLINGTWVDALSSAIVGRADIADRLIVELTESQAIEDVDTTRKIFSTLKAMGLRTAIDDFGAGYTSFKHLRGLDVDLLKIDGAFVQNIGRSADDSFFVRTLIDLAQHLGMETVAEWVRDEASAKKLLEWGVTYLQGEVVGATKVVEIPRAGGATRAA